MKKRHYIPIAILLALLGGLGWHSYNASQQPPSVQPPSLPPVTATPPVVDGCDPALWNFVYHPDRLPTKDDCRTVTGAVRWVKHEPDGDYHIRLQLDNPDSAPVNSANIGGYLVVEPICQTQGMPQPTQADAVQVCASYVSNNEPQFVMPSAGARIRVSGFYTEDLQHQWMELHAVSHLQTIN